MTDIDEKWGEPINTKDEGVPHSIWFAKAAFQLGHDVLVREKDGEHQIRLPKGPEDTVGAIWMRAKWLEERENQGLPVDPLPSGRFPDDPEEFADQIPLVVASDIEHREVYIDFAKPLRALGISPAMARTLAMKLHEVADIIDPDGSMGMKNPSTVAIGHVKVPGSSLVKEGLVVTPGLVDDLKLEGEGESDG